MHHTIPNRCVLHSDDTGAEPPSFHTYQPVRMRSLVTSKLSDRFPRTTKRSMIHSSVNRGLNVLFSTDDGIQSRSAEECNIAGTFVHFRACFLTCIRLHRWFKISYRLVIPSWSLFRPPHRPIFCILSQRLPLQNRESFMVLSYRASKDGRVLGNMILFTGSLSAKVSIRI